MIRISNYPRELPLKDRQAILTLDLGQSSLTRMVLRLPLTQVCVRQLIRVRISPILINSKMDPLSLNLYQDRIPTN